MARPCCGGCADSDSALPPPTLGPSTSIALGGDTFMESTTVAPRGGDVFTQLSGTIGIRRDLLLGIVIGGIGVMVLRS